MNLLTEPVEQHTIDASISILINLWFSVQDLLKPTHLNSKIVIVIISLMLGQYPFPSKPNFETESIFIKNATHTAYLQSKSWLSDFTIVGLA